MPESLGRREQRREPDKHDRRYPRRCQQQKRIPYEAGHHPVVSVTTDGRQRVLTSGCRHPMLTPWTRAMLTQYLARAGGDPLEELRLTLSLQEQLEVLQLQAVRNAVLAHSWSEIGSALGVTKQAAHRKFVSLLAEDVRTQKRRIKQAQRAGQPAEVGAALTAALEGVEVLRKVGRRR